MTLDEKCDQLRERIEMLVVEMANDQRKLHDRLVKLDGGQAVIGNVKKDDARELKALSAQRRFRAFMLPPRLSGPQRFPAVITAGGKSGCKVQEVLRNASCDND